MLDSQHSPTFTTTLANEVMTYLPGATGGGSGTVVDEVFNAEDDGFDVSTLDAKWTQGGIGTQPTVVINSQEARSHYLAKFAGAATGQSTLQQAFAPAGDFSLTMKYRALFSSGANTSVVLYVANAGFTAGVYIQCQGVTANATFDFKFITLVTGTLIGTLSAMPCDGAGIYIHVQRVGTTWTALLSLDGVSWRTTSTHTQTASITTMLINLQQSAAIKEWIGVDWIRRDWFFW